MMGNYFRRMFTLRQKLEMLFIISMGTALCLLVLVVRNMSVDRRVFSATIPMIIPTNLPIVTPFVSPYPIDISTMNSPDGTKSLVMKKQQINNLTSYSFYTLSPDTEEKMLLQKDVGIANSLSIPYNTWSPDNAYIFLKESTSSLPNYYILAASGNPFSETAQYVNIQDLFVQNLPNYIISDVTGWAGPTLIVVNAVNKENNQNVSFWFDVNSSSFLQLGTYFN